MLFHHKALYIRKKIKYREGIAKSLKNIGEVYLDINQPDSAMQYFEESLQICKRIHYTKGIVKNVHSQGISLRQLHNPSAIDKFKQALSYSEKVGYKLGVIRAICELADMYKSAENYQQAIHYAKKGLDIAQQEHMKSHMAALYHTMAETYKQVGNFKAAYFYLEKQMQVQHKLLSPETNKKIAHLQTQYETSLQVQENEVLKKENQIQELRINRKNTYIVFAISTLVLLFLLVLLTYKRYLQKNKAHKELQHLNAQLTEAKAQQIKLFSIISHELRNPLFWFRNLVQLLTEKIDTMDKDMVAKSLDSLGESATNTFHLMDNLLHWSRAQLGNISYRPEVFALHEVVNENIRLVAQYAKQKGIEVHYVPHSAIRVQADKAMLTTVIRNLLSNALKFTPTDGKITLELKQLPQFAEIKIADTGKGMDASMVNRIINAEKNSYIPSSSPETGSGIGLSVSKEFIELNGGKLRVESRAGQGSTFLFDVPLASCTLA